MALIKAPHPLQLMQNMNGEQEHPKVDRSTEKPKMNRNKAWKGVLKADLPKRYNEPSGKSAH